MSILLPIHMNCSLGSRLYLYLPIEIIFYFSLIYLKMTFFLCSTMRFGEGYFAIEVGQIEDFIFGCCIVFAYLNIFLVEL